MDFLVEYNGGELDYYNHNNDNSFFTCNNKTEYENWLKRFDCIFLGFSKHYNFKVRDDEDELAFVYMDSDGEIQWTHFPILSLNNLVDGNLSFKERNAKVKEFLDSINYVFKNKVSAIYFA